MIKEILKFLAELIIAITFLIMTGYIFLSVNKLGDFSNTCSSFYTGNDTCRKG